MRGKFLIGLIVASILLLAAIYFLLPPAPGEPGDAPPASEETLSQNDPFAFGDEPGAPADIDAEELTPEQIAAFEKMHAEMPGNIFLPILPTGEDRARVEERDRTLRQMRAIHFKIEKNEADPAERERYYDFRIRYNLDKIAMLKYMAVKRPGTDGKARLPELIQQMIAEMEAENKDFAAKR